MNVLRTAHDAGVETTVLISSLVVFDTTCTITETSPLAPLSSRMSPYTRTKLAVYAKE